MRVALAGNPNSGKTTVYNALTGRSEKVGNWAGVTVAKKEHPIKKNYCTSEELIAVDLPGAYSMSPFTSEESITSSFVKHENPDAIINIVDATNLSRSLFFTTQLLELGVPVVVALNKFDVNEKKETKIDVDKLSAALGCPVINTTATTADGLAKVTEAVTSLKGKGQVAPYTSGDIDLTDKNVVETADKARFEFVNKIVKDVETRKVLTREKTTADKVDAVLTNPIFGIPIFAVIMFFVFWVSQAGNGLGVWLSEGVLVPAIEWFGGVVSGWMANASPILQTIIVDGIIGGVGAVVGFLPLVMVMYFFIALLEDCGYMSRVSVVLDPIFKKVGLSGKSIIPFVIGVGCSIPGVMACRTIRNERERNATAMLTPFMPCGAKLPIIALFAGAFFADAWWVAPLMYFTGILLIFLGALLVNAITGYKNRKSFFIMEQPEYKVPSLKFATMSMLNRAKAYIIKAGTIILVCNAIVTIMQNFSWSFQLVDDPSASILATIAKPFAFLFIPLGFGVWQMAAAAVTGFIAKENVVATLAGCYAIATAADDEFALASGQSEAFVAALAITKVVALAYLMFNLFTPPCFAAMGAMNSEMKSKKWLWGGIGLQFAVGYIVAFLVYQIGTLITTGALGTAFLPGLIAVLVMVGIVVALCINSKRKLKAEYALSK